MKARHIGQVSFNLRDGYESRLYEYATRTDHGEFSKYIKRLIERDMSGSPAQAITVKEAVNDVDVNEFL